MRRGLPYGNDITTFLDTDSIGHNFRLLSSLVFRLPIEPRVTHYL